MRFVLLVLLGKVAAVAVGWAHPVCATILWLAPDLLLAYQVLWPHAQGLVQMPRRFRTSQAEVWLTIDDGPHPEDTPRILALLAAHRARATFFVIGERAARHPGVIQAIVAGGHEVAHHTHTHPLGTFWIASPARVARELDMALDVLRSQGVRPTRFRPPAGIKNLWLAGALRDRQLAAVGWSARGLEVNATDAAAVADRVLRDVAPGAILLLHEGPRLPASIRVVAIGLVLARLEAAGYRCVVPEAGQLNEAGNPEN